MAFTHNSQDTDPFSTSDNQKKKRRAAESVSFSDEDESTFPSYLVAASVDDQPINLSIFGIQKLLSCAIGDIKSAKKLRNGTVLIEVRNKHQANAALKMTNWVSQPVKVTPHRSLNTSRGIIRCRDFRDCDDAEVLNALSSQGVTSAKRLMTKRNNALEPTNTFVLIFGLPTPPKSLKAAYMRLDVEAYVPNPLRCYNCQHYGHGKATCNRKAVCAKCSQEGHQDTECENSPHCANCAGNHSAYSRDCPEWFKQKEITQIKFEKNISFGDARKIVEQRVQANIALNGGSASYAKITASTNKQTTATSFQMNKQMQSIEVQTDLTWPSYSDMPSLHLSSKSTAAAQTDMPAHIVLGQAGEGGLDPPTLTAPAHSVAGAAGGGSPPQVGDKPSSKSNTPVGRQSTLPVTKVTANFSRNTAVPAPKEKQTKPSSSNRPQKGHGDIIKLANKYSSLDEMAMDLGGASSSSPSKGKIK